MSFVQIMRQFASLTNFNNSLPLKSAMDEASVSDIGKIGLKVATIVDVQPFREVKKAVL